MSEIYKPNYVIDLHSHTTRSDGNDEPAEFLRNAASVGMSVVAITDHDVFPPEFVSVDGKDIRTVEYAGSLGISVLLGIEVSCDTNVDDVHVVGFGCDWNSETIAWLPSDVEESKVISYRQVVERLRDNGFDVSWSELTEDAGRSDSSVQKKHIFELIASKGYTENWQAAKIMVRDNPDYDVKRRKPDAVDIIHAIHNAGGFAILAHPYLIDENVTLDSKIVSRDEYIRRLIDAGLDGIESVYTYDKTSYKGKQSPSEIAKEVVERYGKLVNVISGGSDYHADHKKGTSNSRRIGDAGVEVEYFRNNKILSALIEKF
ncbi:MAG: PHP domain-containing protein [Planctomycetaceae bacterium]|jgi:predicted metal-dependent phosphoesterase TrpH|nr:PHP domain-containing protein [Planctomycetaceae bacterium]